MTEDIEINTILTESQNRLYEKLYRDLGDDLICHLQNSDINEVLLNPDGKLWIDSSSDGLNHVDNLNPAQAFSIINDIAGLHNVVVTHQSPLLEAEFPHYKSLRGERFTALIPPIVSGPSFTIRKRPEKVFNLNDYVTSGRMTERQATILSSLVKERKNILVTGGPGSGKTTVTNALILTALESDKKQRFVILEDLPELQCKASNVLPMLTSNEVNMTGLLRSAMRMRPDRILIGEVRGSEALDMLKAWNTGCPGGICTVHANGAEEAIQRILDLSMEAGLIVRPIQLVVHTIDVVVFVARQGSQKGFVKEIVALKGMMNEKLSFENIG